jgi:hypothetical protein
MSNVAALSNSCPRVVAAYRSTLLKEVAALRESTVKDYGFTGVAAGARRMSWHMREGSIKRQGVFFRQPLNTVNAFVTFHTIHFGKRKCRQTVWDRICCSSN